MVGGGVKILRSAAVAFHGAQLRVAWIERRATEAEQLLQQVVHGFLRGSFDLQAKVGRVAIGAPDAELLDFEAAVIFDNFVEDFLHDMRVDQVALGLDYFLELHRSFILTCLGVAYRPWYNRTSCAENF